MANQPLTSVYNGGAVGLNSQPYIQAHVQALARKQAQEDALGRYFGDLGKNLTPAGMHSNDIDALMQKKNAWQQYVMQNREAYLHPSKDNGEVYTKAMGMYNDALAHAQTSKQKVSNLSGIASIVKDPAKRSLLTDKTFHDIQAAELPVSDPNYRPIDLTDIAYNPKPWDIKDQNNLLNQVSKFKGTEEAPTITKDPRNKQLILTYRNKFGQDDLLGMHNMGSSLYGSNPGFKKIVDTLAEAGADPTSVNHEEYIKLNDLFKQHYGQDIQSPEDIAGAYVLSLNPAKSGRTVVKNDAAALNEQRSGLTLNRYYARGAHTGNNWVNDATAAIGSGNPQEVSKVFGHLFAGNGTAKHQEAKISPDGSSIQLNYITKAKDKYGPYDEKHTMEIPLNDPNLKDKLAGYYQLATGSDKKTEAEPYYKQSEAAVPPKKVQGGTSNWKNRAKKVQ